MINIVFEGPDHSGKSTLAKAVAEALKMPYMASKGVPKTFDEVCERVRHYNDNLNGYIIDRHPCISQPIYGTLRKDPPLPNELIEEFYRQRPLLVYCCAGTSLTKHVPSENDTPEHLEALRTNFKALRDLYDDWAFWHAHIFYRDYNETERVIAMTKGLIIHEYRRH